MLMKRSAGVITAVSVFAAAFCAPCAYADEALPVIACTQSASFLADGSGNATAFVLNTADDAEPANISWNTAVTSWKGVGVLEFELPAADPTRLKTAELTVTVHNGSSRSGTRTYDVYPADVTIDASTTADMLKAMPLGESLYQAPGVPQGVTRTDTIAEEPIRAYVKEKMSAEEQTTVQFAFSNSSQALDIDPSTASLSLVLYDGGVALDKTSLTLSTAGEPQQLTYSIFGEGIDASSLVWTSSDETVATVDGTGLVTPHKAGTAVISLKTSDGSFSADCAVTVEQSAESISMDRSSLALLAGGRNGELTAKLTPDTAVNRRINWTSSNEAVASVSGNGIITPLSPGETVITASSAENAGLTAECVVTVSAMADAESITLDRDTLTLPKLGATAVLAPTILPANADDRVTWSSDNETVAKVYDGVIVSGEPGTATVTAAAANGKTAQCTVTVTEDDKLITNDRFYTDTDGNVLYSQGGGIFKFPNDDKYYWYGVRYKEAVTYAEDPSSGGNVEHPAFEAYTCYTSDDLVNWKYEGDVATMETLGQDWCGWAGRCGVVYHEPSGKYVLVSQFNGTIIASAESPLGPFTTEKGYFWFGESLPVIANGDTGDLTMFYDDDGMGYMICSSASGREHLYVVPMDAEKDFCDFDFDNIKELGGSTGSYYDEDGTVKKKDKGGIEGDCMFKYKDHYYFTGSDLYGWRGSRVYVFESEDILGSYDLKPSYADTTQASADLPYIMPGVKNSYAHNSQTGFYYTLHGTTQDTVIYCGDRWCDFGAHGIGYNQWVPLTMDGYTPHFNDLSQWRLDEVTGEWTIGDGNNYIANPEFDADRIDLNYLTGWEHSDSIGGTAGGNVKARRHHGNYAAKHSADTDYTAVMKQKISDLPDGTYTLRASVISSGGQNECLLYADADGERYSTSLRSQMSGWTDVVVKNITVSGGECEIGLYSDTAEGGYVRIDDMYLTRNYDGTVIEGRLNTNVPAEKAGTSVMLTDADGSEIDSLSGGDICAAAEYVNDTSDTAEAALYLALYDNDGGLIAVKSASAPAKPDETVKISTDAAGTDGAAYAKAFLWDGKMTPLVEAVTAE